MDGNGADRYAQLEARVAELEAAVGILSRRLNETWTEQLAAIERDVHLIAAELAARRPTPGG